MNINKYTEKAREAVAAAVDLAQTGNNPQLEPEHLLAALVDQRDGIVPGLLRKLNVEPSTVSSFVATFTPLVTRTAIFSAEPTTPGRL